MELQAQRKAHSDSLMQVRAQMEAQEEAVQKQNEKRKGICSFLTSFYQKAVLVDDADANFYSRYLTDYCRRIVFGVPDGYDADVDEFDDCGGEPSETLLPSPTSHSFCAI